VITVTLFFYPDQRFQHWLVGDVNGDNLDDLMTAEGVVIVY
jgi:hypothetical protein